MKARDGRDLPKGTQRKEEPRGWGLDFWGGRQEDVRNNQGSQQEMAQKLTLSEGRVSWRMCS